MTCLGFLLNLLTAFFKSQTKVFLFKVVVFFKILFKCIFYTQDVLIIGNTRIPFRDWAEGCMTKRKKILLLVIFTCKDNKDSMRIDDHNLIRWFFIVNFFVLFTNEDKKIHRYCISSNYQIFNCLWLIWVVCLQIHDEREIWIMHEAKPSLLRTIKLHYIRTVSSLCGQQVRIFVNKTRIESL